MSNSRGSVLRYLDQSVSEDLDRARRAFRLKALVIVDGNGRLVRSSVAPGTAIDSLPAEVLSRLEDNEVFFTTDSQWIAARRSEGPGQLEIRIAVFPVPERIAELTSDIVAERANFTELVRNQRYYRDTYVYILVLITVLVLFASVWIGLFISKRITVPIEALSEATREISAGNLAHRVNVKADDELGLLVRLFNNMAEQLKETTEELENRRRYTEIILESIPAGVISVDTELRVTMINRAARTMFAVETVSVLKEVFTDDLEDIEELLRTVDREGAVTREVAFSVPGRTMHSAVTVSRLTAGGVVLVVRGPHRSHQGTEGDRLARKWPGGWLTRSRTR